MDSPIRPVTTAIVGCLLIATLCGNSCGANSDKAFKAIRKCAGGALQRADTILYFGPTNVPIGTIYEKAGGGYDTFYKGTTITGAPPTVDMVEPPKYASCTFDGSSKIDLKLAFGVSANALPVAGELSNDLQRATVLRMSADQFGWETLYKGPYLDAIAKNAGVNTAMSGRDMYATVALLKVKGYSVTMQVNTTDSAMLKAKYPYPSGQLPAGATGDITASVGVTWEGNETLTLNVSDETTVGGVLRAFKKGGLASGSTGEDAFGPSVGSDREIVSLQK